MKKFILLLSFLVLYSCNVQKRHYTKGYYVDWNSKKQDLPKEKNTHTKTTVKTNPTPSREVLVHKNERETPLEASADTKTPSVLLKKTQRFHLNAEDSCDVLIFRDGSEIRAKIQEVGLTEIRYKRCGHLDGPTHISRKNEIFMIKYANGTKEVFRAENNPPQPQVVTYEHRKTEREDYRDYNRKVHPLAIASLILGVASAVSGLYILVISTELLFSFGLFIIPFLLGLAAFITGQIAFKEIRAEREVWKGKGLAGPGSIIGIIVAAIAAMILFIAGSFGAL